jgi:SNF2 family DNA or RNA helicase/HJR/Mrr/RecB family endonuclease
MESWVSSLFKFAKNEQSFAYDVTEESVDFYVEKNVFQQIKNGSADNYLTAQYVSLKILSEQGDAVELPNGFEVSSDAIASLDDDVHELLGLPPKWVGSIEADIKGTTNLPNFRIDLKVESPAARLTSGFKTKGAVIEFGEQHFVLKEPVYSIFKAKEQHAKSSLDEYDNLSYLHTLQVAQANGARLKLGHFNKLKISVPQKITVEAELDSNGNLILTPNAGQDASYDEMQRVLGQILDDKSRTIKVGDEIILFDEKRANAAREVIANRTIPRSQVQRFLKTPSAFLNAALVDLDVGFALRVRGAIRFKHAYFGETDESGINWFGESASSGKIEPIGAIKKVIKTAEDLQLIKKVIEDAHFTGATEIEFEGKSYDIGNKNEVENTLIKIDQDISDPANQEPELEPDSPNIDEPKDDIDTSPIVLDIALNDDELDEPSKLVEEQLKDVLFKEELDWSNHKRTPFPHQKIGVKWILGLEEMSRLKEMVNGALLADDMGLGKTFMSLSATEHYYRLCRESDEKQRPTLIVAPLSLLENWKDEVGDTFYESPFSDIVILQTDGELNKFRCGSTETKQDNIDEETFEPRYSLKFGDGHGLDRLDMPRRLVITTYQTLRDYQFSLSQIDWGLAIFDEAQNIKNPNALQTRAAKGLKAKFKLLATGTPVENSLADFWCLMDTACPGYLDSYQSFRSKYISPILQAAGDEIDQVRSRLGRDLRETVGSLMLRRIKEDNLEGLPEKRIFVGIEGQDWQFLDQLHSVMSGFQRKVYDGSIEAQLEGEDSHVLTTLQRLRDSSLHPRLADAGRLDAPTNKRELKGIFEESSKLSGTIKILTDIKKRNEKCIIFTVNKRLQRFLSVALGSYFALGPLHIINGDAKAVSKRDNVPTRKTMIKDFEARQGFNIIIMSPVAAGVGLTVVGANNVIHYERHWNPAKEAQATDRVFRIGQTKDVNIYVPILHHPEFESFDVNLHKLLSQKSMLKDAVVTPGEVIPNPTGSDKHDLSPDSVILFDDLQKLSWKQFEAFCVELLAKEYQAQSAWLTKDGADYGADGVLAHEDTAILIQAKHKKGSYKGHQAVQEVSQASKMYEQPLGRKIVKQLFVTNATKLAKNTYDVAKKLNVEVIEGNALTNLCEQHQIQMKQVLVRLEKKRFSI